MKAFFHSENIHPYCQPGAVHKTEGNGTFRVLKGLSTEQKIRVQTKSAAGMVPVKYLTQYTEAKFDRFFSITATEHWHSFPRGVVESASLEILKCLLDVIPGSLLSRKDWTR